MSISINLSDNIQYLHKKLPIDKSFDFITKDLVITGTKAFWIGINGLCKTDILQRIFTELQKQNSEKNASITNIKNYIDENIGYVETKLTDNWDDAILQVLSGATCLLVDGFSQVILLDVKSYPKRSIEEPDTEKVTNGSKDGFVETLIENANLIRRRIRDYNLTFELISVGTDTKTDVSITYLGNLADESLLNQIREKLQNLHISSLTMGSKSLEELLVPKRWFNPLPTIHMTERPDVACSYLLEGYILLLVDNSPSALILPCTIFQFLQNPEDYYKSPSVGNYIRLGRYTCVFLSLFLLPVFLLITAFFPDLSDRWQLLTTVSLSRWQIFFYILAVEFFLDLLKYAASHSPEGYSGSLSIVGGLLIGDIAVSLNWASLEVLFYASVTLLTTLVITDIAFEDAIRLYRLMLIILTGLGGLLGFCVGFLIMVISIISTPTFSHMSYFWPLYPFHWKALKTLLFRYPTSKAQPVTIWKR